MIATKDFKSKAQVEAPVELFIAIIVLAMSMALAFMVMSQTEEGKCIATLKTEIDALKSAMNEVAIGASGTSNTRSATARKTSTRALKSCSLALE